MTTFQDFSVGEVQAVQSVTGLGHGFSIRNKDGAPLLSLRYRTEADAEKARQAMETALGDAIELDVPRVP